MPQKSKFILRAARTTDVKVIAEYNCAMALETEQLVLDTRRVRDGVRSFLKNSSHGFYLLAEYEKHIAGQLMITYEWSDWRNGVFWWIQSVYVAPAFRGKGVFASLYTFVKTKARKEKNVCGLRLYVEQSNATAQKVYGKLGMKKTDYEVFEEDFVLKR